MIDSETGLPMTFPGGGSQAAAPSQPYAAPPTPPGISYAPGATQLYQPNAMGSGQAMTGQGGGMSPLLMQLLGGGVTPGSGMGGQIMPLLMQYLMGQQQQQQPQPPGLPPGFGGTPQVDPLTPQQRAFMGYGGPGQPADWYAAMGMPGGAQGTTSPMYQPATPQQNFTPQDFVSQWNQLYGRS